MFNKTRSFSHLQAICTIAFSTVLSNKYKIAFGISTKIVIFVHLKKIVGHRLQMLRMEKNLTQEQMGEKLNLSTSAYCKIEYGETDLTLTRLNKIAEVLNMSALELFNKIDGNVYVNNSGTIGTNIGVAKDCSSVHIEAADDLRELIKANSRLLDMLYKRIELLENKVLL